MLHYLKVFFKLDVTNTKVNIIQYHRKTVASSTSSSIGHNKKSNPMQHHEEAIPNNLDINFPKLNMFICRFPDTFGNALAPE